MKLQGGINALTLTLVLLIVVGVAYLVWEIENPPASTGTAVGLIGGFGLLGSTALFDLPITALIGAGGLIFYGLYSLFTSQSSSSS